MPYVSSTPGRPLGDFVERFWQFGDAPEHLMERILPSGTIELVVNLHEDELRICDPKRPSRCRKYSGAVVSGAYGGFFVIDTLEHASIIGVHFRFGGALPFFGVPASELANTHVDLETLWGRPAIELRERLCAAVGPAERFRLLEKALAARWFGPCEHGAVRMALHSDRGGKSVRQSRIAAQGRS